MVPKKLRRAGELEIGDTLFRINGEETEIINIVNDAELAYRKVYYFSGFACGSKVMPRMFCHDQGEYYVK